MYDPLWGEYDKREGSDLFFCAMGYDRRVTAAKYDKNTNTVSSVFHYLIPDSVSYLAGLTNKDADGDGFPDLGTGGVRGDIVIFEYDESIGNYRDVWYGDGGTFNVYIHFNSNDIDKNGKKEIWAGGAAFYDEGPKTRFSCLEAAGNNEYEIKHVIDIEGIFSTTANNGFTVDIDKDGTEEIGLCVGSAVILLKFTGEKNNWGFELFYLTIDNTQNNENYGAIMYDADADGFEELFMMVGTVFNNYQDVQLKTNIYKPGDIVEVKQNQKSGSIYNLQQNYPNPFNPQTNIEYTITSTSNVKIEVFNILGENVSELINRVQNSGSYRITFDGSDLAGGIYFIKMTAGSYSKTIKALLIK